MTSILRLRPMQEQEFDAFFEQVVEGTVQDYVESYEIDAEQAKKVARGQLSNRLGDRLDTQDNFFFIVERTVGLENSALGHIWVSINEEERYAWLDTIELHEDFRGQGFGSQLLDLLEEELSRRGIRSLGLHVAAKNERALKLYQKTGFKFTGHNMKKDW